MNTEQNGVNNSQPFEKQSTSEFMEVINGMKPEPVDLSPYLSDKVKSLQQSPSTELSPEEWNGDVILKAVFLGVAIKSEEVEEEQLKRYAEMMNFYAEEGAIEYGSICPPFKLKLTPLAIEGAKSFNMICWYPMSRYTVEELKEKYKDKHFFSEGGIPTED